uniref:Uncharacterized protein n=1 Tax=Timema genevievae TaxID=629358 RepID=A0A7R9K5A6_TIMGE|nr:unnamed protein product [Timema genevievae]
MRRLAVFVCLPVFWGMIWAAALPSGEKYTDRYDHIDVDVILSNKRTTNVYVKCILEEGACPPEGKELKAQLPEALRTTCAKCTETQKKFVRRVSKYLIENQPENWNKISDHYDKERKYADSFNKFIYSDD